MAEGRDTPDLPRGLIDRRGTPIGKGTRLPSIRGPRDLTLGGIPKKIFTPNIPVRKPAEQKEEKQQKEKDKVQAAEQNETKSKAVKDVKPKLNTGSRGRGKPRDIIQSHSIFEQGPSSKDVPKATVKDIESVGGKFHAKTPSFSSPRKVKSEIHEDTKEVLDFLLRDDFIDDKHKRDKYMEPVHLPLSKLNLKLEQTPVEVKDDPDGDVDMSDEQLTKIKHTGASDNVLEALTKTDVGELLFFQFPDCMPGTPANRTPVDSEEKGDQPSQSQRLSDFSEGSVGKLVIRKSGRAQLIMGNITMDVSMGTKCGFLQDVVSIRTKETSGDLSVLGHIKHRLVCTPDFDSMLIT